MSGKAWAKLEVETGAALPLLDHGLDVAAAMRALLDGGAWNGALEAAAGRRLTGQDRERLVALAALHDLGKTNSGFQARRDPQASKVGHTGVVAALLRDEKLRASAPAGALVAIVRDWGIEELLAAVMAHHGRPLDEFASSEAGARPWDKHRRWWRADGGYDPLVELSGLLTAVRERFPLAWRAGVKLPDAAPFVSLVAGLMTLADWLGSDVRRFPVAGPHGVLREPMRSAQAADTVAARGLAALGTPVGGFGEAFGFKPRGIQAHAAADDLGPVALIEAETGSGKTEAALWRWLELRRRGAVDGLYFALPTRSAAVQLHRRVDAMLKRLWGDAAPEAVLAVPGYLRAGDAEGQMLPDRAVRWDEPVGDARWAAERPKRYLAARVAVGTIDQALLGALKLRHAHLRAAMLARSLLVVDEVHASDTYMGGLLEALLRNHVGAGGQALLLSATLGAAARARLLGGELPSRAQAEAVPYPALSGSGAPPRAGGGTGKAKRVSVELAPLMDDADAIATRAVDAARAGASVLVIRNSVGGAVVVARAVEALAPELAFRVGGVATLHHGRFAASDRRLLDAGVEAAFGKARSATGRVLVGTQTLEQSLDIDADLLFTDLAPIDILLQRVGRLHRHARGDRGAFGQARAVVLRPAERALSRLLGRVRERHGLGPIKDGAGVYPDLAVIEATLRLLEADPVIEIPADNRRLVEGALHPEVLDAVAAELGTQWLNHQASMEGLRWADRGEARQRALDLGTPFRDLNFPNAAERIASRLGARDLLIDFAEPIRGPFGQPVRRVAIPHWLSGGIGPDDEPVSAGPAAAGTADAEGVRFRLGERLFYYGRWGLAPVAA